MDGWGVLDRIVSWIIDLLEVRLAVHQYWRRRRKVILRGFGGEVEEVFCNMSGVPVENRVGGFSVGWDLGTSDTYV
jgi:hypothetical protein